MVVPAMAAEDIKAAMPPAAQHEKFGAERNILASMLMNGTISEDTYTAIEEYFKQNPPAKPDGEADFDGRRPPQGGMLNADMLQALLDANVITTDEYNTLLAALPTPPED